MCLLRVLVWLQRPRTWAVARRGGGAGPGNLNVTVVMRLAQQAGPGFPARLVAGPGFPARAAGRAGLYRSVSMSSPPSCQLEARRRPRRLTGRPCLCARPAHAQAAAPALAWAGGRATLGGPLASASCLISSPFLFAAAPGRVPEGPAIGPGTLARLRGSALPAARSSSGSCSWGPSFLPFPGSEDAGVRNKEIMHDLRL